MCDISTIYVFVVNILKVFPVGLSNYSLKPLVSIPLGLVIIGIIIHFMLHLGVCIVVVVGVGLHFYKGTVSLSHYETITTNKLPIL
jgi:hypothetical protein